MGESVLGFTSQYGQPHAHSEHRMKLPGGESEAI
jgi:hypothetical protein